MCISEDTAYAKGTVQFGAFKETDDAESEEASGKGKGSYSGVVKTVYGSSATH